MITIHSRGLEGLHATRAHLPVPVMSRGILTGADVDSPSHAAQTRANQWHSAVQCNGWARGLIVFKSRRPRAVSALMVDPFRPMEATARSQTRGCAEMEGAPAHCWLPSPAKLLDRQRTCTHMELPPHAASHDQDWGGD